MLQFHVTSRLSGKKPSKTHKKRHFDPLKSVQKKVKKKLTGDTVFARLVAHAGKRRQQTKQKMRTKTLLIAAAALAATVISSEAQTVFSATMLLVIVNVTVVPAGAFQFIANPLTTGNDVLTNVLKGAPGGAQVQIWNPGTGSFNPLTFSGPPANRHWVDGSSVNQDNTPVPPGTGYFILTGSNYTNTFVGTVVTPVGGTSTNVIPASLFEAVGSLTPYGDSITNTATLNLVPGLVELKFKCGIRLIRFLMHIHIQVLQRIDNGMMLAIMWLIRSCLLVKDSLFKIWDLLSTGHKP